MSASNFTREDWIRIAALTLCKLCGTQKAEVILTPDDIDRIVAGLGGMPAIVVDETCAEGLKLTVVSNAEAQRIAYHRRETGQPVDVQLHSGRKG